MRVHGPGLETTNVGGPRVGLRGEAATARRPGAAARATALAAALLAPALGSPVRGADPTVEELLRRTDDLLRGASSHGRIAMSIATESWQRELELESWSQGPEKTLVRILAPAKERGTATLKVDASIWNYLPKVDRTIKVPASMMSAAWMGSHFTNDDLVRESRFEEDYACAIEQRPGTGGDWLLSCTPHADAPVVWGRVDIRLDGGDQLVREVVYYDERGAPVRTMTYDDIGELAGRRLPRRLRMIPADRPGEHTEIRYLELELEVAIPDGTFTLQGLRR